METLNKPQLTDQQHKILGALQGAWIGDSLAMPVHWYYNRAALCRDYGYVTELVSPKNPHPDSIFWRSSWKAPSPELDILGEQRKHWGTMGIHYHQHLKAGENTLTIKIASQAWDLVSQSGTYDEPEFLRRYIDLMTHPERHRDTYIEECHRGFFTNLGRGLPPNHCAVDEKHISGLAMMLPIPIYFSDDLGTATKLALKHLALTHAGKKMEKAAQAILSLLLPVLGGASLEETIRHECSIQRNPHFGFPFTRWLEKEDGAVIGRKLSTACYVEDAVPAVIYLALKYCKRPEEGLVANTNLGGDNVHRGAVLGALLGAENGIAGWPSRWVDALISPPQLNSKSF